MLHELSSVVEVERGDTDRSPNGLGRFGCPVSVLTLLPDSSRRPVMYLPV
jgi:hypothetical protein